MRVAFPSYTQTPRLLQLLDYARTRLRVAPLFTRWLRYVDWLIAVYVPVTFYVYAFDYPRYIRLRFDLRYALLITLYVALFTFTLRSYAFPRCYVVCLLRKIALPHVCVDLPRALRYVVCVVWWNV